MLRFKKIRQPRWLPYPNTGRVTGAMEMRWLSHKDFLEAYPGDYRLIEPGNNKNA